MLFVLSAFIDRVIFPILDCSIYQRGIFITTCRIWFEKAGTCFPIVGFQIVSSIYFQAVGKPKLSFLISMSRQILVLIPCLFSYPPFGV